MSAGRRQGGARAAAPAAHDRDRQPAGGERATSTAAVLLVLTIVGTAIVVDVRATASFDAPKRLVAMLGLAGAAACLLAAAVAPRRTPTTSSQRAVLIALGLAFAGALVATLASPRGAIARDGFRTPRTIRT